MAIPRPTLLFDFAGMPDALDPRITFSRGSVGSYYDRDQVLRYRPANAPRFSYGPNGLANGLLLDRQHTNRILWSENFTNAAWGNTGVSVTPATMIAPDGNNTGATLTVTASVGMIYQTPALTAGNNIAWQVYVAPNASNWAILALYSGVLSVSLTCWFDLINNVVGSQQLAGSNPNLAFASAGIEVLPNGWRRIRMACTTATITGIYAYVSAADGNLRNPVVGDSIYVWGAQFSDNAASWGGGSYLPTTSSTATMQGDICYLATLDPSWWNATQGTVVFSVTNSPSNNTLLVSLGGTGTADVINIYQQFGFVEALMVNSSVTQFNIFAAAPNLQSELGLPTHVAFAWQNNNFALCAGGTSLTPASGVFTNSFTRFVLGTYSTAIPNGAGNQQFTGCFRRFAYYPTRLTNAQLQQLTAG